MTSRRQQLTGQLGAYAEADRYTAEQVVPFAFQERERILDLYAPRTLDGQRPPLSNSLFKRIKDDNVENYEKYVFLNTYFKISNFPLQDYTDEFQPTKLFDNTDQALQIVFQNWNNIRIQDVNIPCLMLGVEFVLKHALISGEEWINWVKSVELFGENFSLNPSDSADKQEQSGRQLFTMFDVVRYAKFAVLNLEFPFNVTTVSNNVSRATNIADWDFFVNNEQNKNLRVRLPTEKQLQLSNNCEQASKFVLKPSQMIDPKHTVQFSVTSHDGTTSTGGSVWLYPYDTLETLTIRVANEVRISPQFLFFDRTQGATQGATQQRQLSTQIQPQIDPDASKITVKILQDTAGGWTYNPFQRQTIVFRASGLLLRRTFTLQELRDNKESAENLINVSAHLLRDNNLNDIQSVKRSLFSISETSLLGIAQKYLLYFGSPAKLTSGEFQAQLLITWSTINFQQMQQQDQNNKIQMSILMTAPKLIQYEPVQQTEYSLDGSFTILRNDIFDFFNRLQVSKLIPFAKCKTFVKAYNNHKFPEEWTQQQDTNEKEETLVLYVCTSDAPTITKNSFQSREYVTVRVTQAETTLRHTTFHLHLENTDVAYEPTILQNLFYNLPIFNNKLPVQIELKRRFSQGLTVFPNLELSEPTFFEFVLNNPLFQNTVRVKESNVIYRERGGIPLKLMLDKNTQMEARLFYKFLETKFEPEVKRFPHIATKDSHIWVLRLQGKLSANYANILVQKLTACLNIMKQQAVREQQMQHFYCHFFTNFEAWLLEQPDIGTDLFQAKTELATEIFIPGYERSTAVKEGKPVVVKVFDETLNEQGIMKGLEDLQRVHQELNLPVGTTGAFVFPPVLPVFHPQYEQNKSLKKYIMKVRDPKYVIAVTESNLQNMRNFDSYPLIPCSMNSPTPLTKIYLAHSLGDNAKTLLEIIDIESKLDKDTRKKLPVTVKNKMLPNGKFGQLPRKLANALNLSTFIACDARGSVDQQQYFRIGIASSPEIPSVFQVVNALIKATNTTANPTQILKRLRELVSTGITASCGMSPAQGFMVLDEKKYMDPQAWYPVLRHAFKTEIILFYQDKLTNVKGSFETEYFERFRLIDKNARVYKKTAILYVHKGAEFDNIVNPQCELVVKSAAEKIKTSDSPFVAWFPTQSPEISFINKMIEALVPTRYLDLDHHLINPTIGENVQQHMDSYGKTRNFTKIIQNLRIPVFCDPIVNLRSTAATTESQPASFSAIDAKQLFGEDHQGLTVVVEEPLTEQDTPRILGFHKTQYVDPNSKIVPYGIFVPCKPESYTTQIERNVQLPKYDLNKYIYPRPLARNNESSFTTKYKKFLKTANYLKYYMFWMFSKTYEEPVFDNISAWFRTRVICVINSQYNDEMFKRLIVANEPQLIENNENFVIRAANKSECLNLKTRLRYILEHTFHYEYNFLRDFKYARYIPNYYNNAAEFTQSSQWTVYDSIENFKLMTMGARTKYDVFARLFPSEESYFVAVKLEGPEGFAQVLLAVPCEDQTQAVNVAWTYNFSPNGSRSITPSAPEDVPFDQLYVQLFDVNLQQTNEVRDEYETRVQVGMLQVNTTEQQWFAFVDYMKFL